MRQQVMDHIGEDGSKCEETVVANGQKTYKVKTSNALRFDSRGSVVRIDSNWVVLCPRVWVCFLADLVLPSAGVDRAGQGRRGSQV